jgi:uncharacterized membrane protein
MTFFLSIVITILFLFGIFLAGTIGAWLVERIFGLDK